MPLIPKAHVIGPAQFGKHRVGTGLQPFDDPFEVFDLHRGATGGAIMVSAPDVKENQVARVGYGMLIVMLDQHHPLIGGIAQMQPFLFPPGRKRRARRKRVEMIILDSRNCGIVDPRVAIGHLMVGPAFGPVRQPGSVAKNKPELEETRRIPMIARCFLRPGLGRMESASPRQAAPSEQDGPGLAVGLPLPRAVPVEQLQRSFKGRSVRRHANNHLLRIEAQSALVGQGGKRQDAAPHQGTKKECAPSVHLRYGKRNTPKRQTNRTMRPQPLPLILLTGFLGSGKTSALQHWLAHTDVPLKRTAVIINDFGSVNVDAALLARRQLELRSITGGCVCCQSFEDLVEQVSALAENPDFDLVWIETSGLADPEEVLDHLSAPELHDSTVIRRVVLVIDGSDFPCSWRGRVVQEEQIRYADLILLNKTDRVDEKARQRIEITLRQINPTARIVSTQNGQVEPGMLSDGEAGTMAVGSRVHAHLDEGHDESHHEHQHHDHGHESLPHAASTFFLPLTAPVERAAFRRFLGALPTSVFRAKGFIRFVDSPDQLHTFQQVRDQAELLLLPLENGTDLATGLVFIGPHLDEKHIRDLADTLILAPASH